MAVKFLKPNHPILKKIAKEIPVSKIKSKKIQDIIKAMLKIAGHEQKDRKKPVMVGLAAPQIGISKRIILVDCKANGKGLPATPREIGLRGGRGKIYINPVITWKSKQKREWYEGCYSIPKVCGIVKRSDTIKIQAFDINGKLIVQKHKSYIARIFQHEIDHLDGKLFISHIKNPNHLHKVLPSEFPLYRNKKMWKKWDKLYPLPLA